MSSPKAKTSPFVHRLRLLFGAVYRTWTLRPFVSVQRQSKHYGLPKYEALVSYATAAREWGCVPQARAIAFAFRLGSQTRVRFIRDTAKYGTIQAPSHYNVSDCFCTTNIPYFLSKVNNLNRSLIFFEHLVHFQHGFFSNYNTNNSLNFKKLQNGKETICLLLHNEKLNLLLQLPKPHKKQCCIWSYL